MNSPDFKNIHVLNRVKLLDDVYFFVINNKLEKKLMLDLTAYLIQEDDYIPWKRAESIFFYILRSRSGKTAENKVKFFQLK